MKQQDRQRTTLIVLSLTHSAQSERAIFPRPVAELVAGYLPSFWYEYDIPIHMLVPEWATATAETRTAIMHLCSIGAPTGDARMRDLILPVSSFEYIRAPNQRLFLISEAEHRRRVSKASSQQRDDTLCETVRNFLDTLVDVEPDWKPWQNDASSDRHVVTIIVTDYCLKNKLLILDKNPRMFDIQRPLSAISVFRAADEFNALLKRTWQALPNEKQRNVCWEWLSQLYLLAVAASDLHANDQIWSAI